MSFKPVFYTIGILLTILSATMLIPTIIDLAHGHDDWKVFAGSQLVTAFVGIAFILSTREKTFHMNVRQAFLVTSLGWFTLPAFAALPFIFSDLDMTYTDAFFEAMSAITTTGATVITGLDHQAPGILLWRSLLQALGGMGVILMALSVLPFLQVGGMQLFKSGALDVEKIMPSASQLGIALLMVYFSLMLACAVLLYIAGLSAFDAFTHAMTTLSTGGMANYDSSIAYFDSTLVENIITVFMIAGSLPFILYLRALKGHPESIIKDTQVRMFLAVLSLFVISNAFYLVIHQDFSFWHALQASSFNITSIMTSTGYATADYNLWGPFTWSVMLLVMIIGGCSGSTAGGMKVFRFQILFAVANMQMKKLLDPHGVFYVRYNNKPVAPPILGAIMGFFFLYAFTCSFMILLLQMCGVDFITAVTGSISALGNIGPGLGEIIGPAGNYGSLDTAVKWIFAMGMLLGRLEIFTVLVLLSPHFWRH